MYKNVLWCLASRATIDDRAAADRLRGRDNAAGIGDNSAEIGDDAAGIVIMEETLAQPLWKKHSLQAYMFLCS